MDRPTPADEPTIPLRIMVFNIEEGGEGVDLGKVVEAIRAADADIVALQEAVTNAGRIAEALGWDFASDRSQVISRFPILEPTAGHGIYVLVEVRAGRVVAVASVHPPAEPYGPTLAGEGATEAEVIALERRLRLPRLAAHLRTLPPMAAAGLPVFLLGDFNAPSHLDWTAETVGHRWHVRVPVAWPMSRAVEAAGFRDTWREIHPDPVAEPGLTWWASRPPTGGYEPGPDTPNDRIDLLYAAGPAVVRDCRIVGEPGAPDVTIAIQPWPSDHRAVVATFEVTPAPMPVLVAVERRLVAIAADVDVRWCRPGAAGERLVVEPAGIAIDLGGETPGRATVTTAGFSAGDHAVVLTDAQGAVLSRATVHVHEPNATTSLTTDKVAYTVGEPIEVAWSLGPGYRWDWIAVFRASTGDLRDAHLVWRHTGALIYGTLRLDAEAAVVDQSSVGGRWPLPPGDYVAAYLLDDGQVAVARAAFTIVP